MKKPKKNWHGKASQAIWNHGQSGALAKEVRSKAEVAKHTRMVIGIDPGFSGALVATDGKEFFRYFPMPVFGVDVKRIDHEELERMFRIFIRDHWMPYIFLERAIPMAMGSAGAFSYGRGFESIIISAEKAGIAFDLIEPAIWTKEMHGDLSRDLNPKARSLIAVEKEFPQFMRYLPQNRNGKYLDGPVDALLIAGYGLRLLNAF